MNTITLKVGQTVTHDGETIAEIVSVSRSGKVVLRLTDGREIEAAEGDRVKIPRRTRRPRCCEGQA